MYLCVSKKMMLLMDFITWCASKTHHLHPALQEKWERREEHTKKAKLFLSPVILITSLDWLNEMNEWDDEREVKCGIECVATTKEKK